VSDSNEIGFLDVGDSSSVVGLVPISLFDKEVWIDKDISVDVQNLMDSIFSLCALSQGVSVYKNYINYINFSHLSVDIFNNVGTISLLLFSDKYKPDNVFVLRGMECSYSVLFREEFEGLCGYAIRRIETKSKVATINNDGILLMLEKINYLLAK
jgi:hypothetical protein